MAINVIRQHQWTPLELFTGGYHYYQRKKEIVMVRRLPAEEAPMTIVTPWDTLVAEAGYMICYEPGDTVWPALEDYHHWPVEPHIFEQIYADWDQTDWQPTPPQARLMELGCKPVYKPVGVWARPLTKSAYVQTMESPQPALIPAGAWLAIGPEGEPYSMSTKAFHTRYEPLSPLDKLLQKAKLLLDGATNLLVGESPRQRLLTAAALMVGLALIYADTTSARNDEPR